MPTTVQVSSPTLVNFVDIVTGAPAVTVPKLSAARLKLSEHVEFVVWHIPSTQ